MTETIGILHPGEMGISVAASALNSGCAVCWVSEGRSQSTRQRAEKYQLVDAGSLEALCQTCSLLISVCPPHAAESVAGQVIAAGFRGVYLDANAIAPQRACQIAVRMAAAGISFVDGGIIGGPAWQTASTWLYLAGEQAGRVGACFGAGPLEIRLLGEQVGQASALKMCYAAYSKGSTALLCAVLGAAEELGVRADLEGQWARDDAGFPAQAAQRARWVTAKAWRFAGEMEEIAATFQQAGLPDGFHQAAAELYRRLVGFKDRDMPPELDEVLAALRAEGNE